MSSSSSKSPLGEALPSPQPGSAAEVPLVTQLRSKLFKSGAAALTDAELLAVLLAGSARRVDAFRVAEGLISRHGTDALPGLAFKAWRELPGVGTATACRIAAALELCRRLLQPRDGPQVGSPAEAYELVRDLAKARKEHLVALYLDSQNRLICRETVSIGSLNTTRTHPREVLQPAIVNSAAGFILVHNHPSGSLTPSADDREFTRRMREAAELMGFTLYDHLIVSSRGFVSLKERGMI